VAIKHGDLELAARPIRAVFYANIVTYDPHFDCLGGEFQGIRIIDGLHFLYVVRGDRKPA
jgi:hypothetical protein